LFESAIDVAFQSVFYLEMHQDNIYFFIFFNLFLTSAHQNDQKTPQKINLKLNKIQPNFKSKVEPQYQTESLGG
jgi:hypothetical protein